MNHEPRPESTGDIPPEPEGAEEADVDSEVTGHVKPQTSRHTSKNMAP